MAYPRLTQILVSHLSNERILSPFQTAGVVISAFNNKRLNNTYWARLAEQLSAFNKAKVEDNRQLI